MAFWRKITLSKRRCLDAADRVEDVAGLIASLSMGCRFIDVLPAIKQTDVRIVMDNRISIPLWPFRVVVIEKAA